MKIGDFYEREELIHTVVEAKRSQLCHKLISDLAIKDGDSKKRKRILDVGCGDGSFIREFKEVCEVFGVDISWRAVKKAREAGVNAYRVDVSSVKLPFEKRFFDVVYMGDVIEHLVNPDFALEEMKRVLKSNGSLCLSTPNLASWYNRILLLFGIQPVFTEVSTAFVLGRNFSFLGQYSKPVGHLRIFTLSSLKQILRLHGYDIVKVRGASNYYIEVKSTIARFVERCFSFFPSLASIIVIFAKPEKKDSGKASIRK